MYYIVLSCVLCWLDAYVVLRNIFLYISVIIISPVPELTKGCHHIDSQGLGSSLVLILSDLNLTN